MPPADTSISQNGEDVIRRFSSFPSLRVIEIECSEFEEQYGLHLAQSAKETLQACSKRNPILKGKSARAIQDTGRARERLAALYPEPMMVRIMYYPENRSWRPHGHRDPSCFYPTRVEDHPV